MPGKRSVIAKTVCARVDHNRIQRAVSREAFSLVGQNYATVEDVDNPILASLGIRLPVVGILHMYDFTGLDAYYKIWQETLWPR